ncbi:MAG: NifB/NifX family molybdenum-iron cluster-binding protein [Bacteroidales bacterium]|nr:NifB/NifX family molybdenum-iron cluster-binding protein [Bacteroidales bacterium]
MKVAIVTVDGKTIGQHFGRSPYYTICTIENQEVVKKEVIERGTGHFAKNQQNQNHNHDHDNTKGHGFGADNDQKHDEMAQEIGDCQILIAGGMGRGAYQRFFMNGINVIMTDERDIDTAVQRYIDGNLPNLFNELTH